MTVHLDLLPDEAMLLDDLRDGSRTEVDGGRVALLLLRLGSERAGAAELSQKLESSKSDMAKLWDEWSKAQGELWWARHPEGA